MHPSFIFSTQASIPELRPVVNLIIIVIYIIIVVGIVIELAETSGNCFVAAGIVMAEKDNLFFCLAEFLNSLKVKIEAWVRKSDASRHQRCNEASF